MPLALDALLVLDAIDRRGSFAAAAAELHRVPSAITYTVRRLEDELGVALFDRRGHRARLTAAGRALLDGGRTLLRNADEVERRVRRIATGWEAELRIAIDTVVPAPAIWPLVAQFDRECHDAGDAPTRLVLATEVLGGTWEALADGRADLVLGVTGDPPPGGGYRQRPLAELAYVFAVAPGHPLAEHAEPIPVASIHAHRIVVAADSSRRLPPRSVGLAGGQDTLTVADLPAKVAAQVAGLGCGFVPAYLAAEHVRAGRLVVKEVDAAAPPQRASIAWRAERVGRALQWWIDAVTRSGIGQQLAAGAPAPRPSRGADGASRRRDSSLGSKASG
jgi:DNA-binding transcriptional LysR family regulator